MKLRRPLRIGLLRLSLLAIVVGVISKEHIADSVAESIKPFG